EVERTGCGEVTTAVDVEGDGVQRAGLQPVMVGVPPMNHNRGQGIGAFLQGDQGGAVMPRAADPIVADAVLQAGLVGVLPYVLRAVIGETLQGWQLAGSEPLGLQDQGPGQGFATEQVDARIGLPGLTQAPGGCRDPGHAGRVAVGYRPDLQANAW